MTGLERGRKAKHGLCVTETTCLQNHKPFLGEEEVVWEEGEVRAAIAVVTGKGREGAAEREEGARTTREPAEAADVAQVAVAGVSPQATLKRLEQEREEIAGLVLGSGAGQARLSTPGASLRI